MSLVRCQISDRIAELTLDDPKRRNAMSLAMAEALQSTFAELENDSGVGAVIVTGAPPAFCAGARLEELDNASRDSLRAIYEGFLAVARSPLPTIAAVNGAAVGAGINLALVCDLRVAAHSARFECRFLDLGLHPGGGHSWMMEGLLGPQGAAALEIFGEALDGRAAVQRGLAWTCVEDDLLLDEARRLAARAAAAPPELVATLKGTMRACRGVSDHQAAVELELEPQLWSLQQPAFKERLAALQREIEKKRERRA